jgi:NADPH:quinone reductase-like Zn-dependent oxidoreductase
MTVAGVVGFAALVVRLPNALLADGTLRIPTQATYQSAQAPEALTALTSQHIQGKLAIHVQ